MKLSESTIELLGYCARLNKAFRFEPGNMIRTETENKAVMVDAQVAETFPVEAGVFDLKLFLTHISPSAEIDFTPETHIGISNGRVSIKYPKLAPELIHRRKAGTLPATQENLLLHADDYADWKLPKSVKPKKNKADQQSHHIVFHSSAPGEPILIDLIDASTGIEQTFTPKFTRRSAAAFRAVFFQRNLVLLPGSYEVGISYKGFGCWKWLHGDVKIFIAAERDRSRLLG